MINYQHILPESIYAQRKKHKGHWVFFVDKVFIFIPLDVLHLSNFFFNESKHGRGTSSEYRTQKVIVFWYFLFIEYYLLAASAFEGFQISSANFVY